MGIKEAIKILRKELGLTQMELATALHVNYTTVSRWETGRSLPNSSMAVYIMHYAKEKHVSKDCIRCLDETLFLAHREGLNVPHSDLYSVERESICQLVDDSPNAIYVADFETDVMLYANHKLEEFIDKKFMKDKNMKCYQFLLGRDTPCPECNKEKLSRDGQVSKYIDTPYSEKRMHVSRRIIEWNGRKAHVQYFTETE